MISHPAAVAVELLAELQELRQRDAAARARFSALAPAELLAEITRLEGEAAAARRVQRERWQAEHPPAPPVEPLDSTDAGPRNALIGHVAGAPVYAAHSFDPHEEQGRRSPCTYLEVEIGGLRLYVDRHGLELVERQGPDSVDVDLTWAEISALIELAQMGALAELAELARRYTWE